MKPEMMKAVVLTEPTMAENVVLSHIPVPQVRPGWVLVKVDLVTPDLKGVYVSSYAIGAKGPPNFSYIKIF